MRLHDSEEFYDDLGGGSDEDLLLSGPFGVEDAPQAVSEYVDFHVLIEYLFKFLIMGVKIIRFISRLRT